VIDTLAIELSTGEQAEGTELLHTYQNVFSKSEYDLGRTSMTEYKIDTGYARPIKQGLRWQPQTSLPIIDTFSENMERQHIIEKSVSPWTSNVFVVNKHDGSPRITFDYPALNNVNYKNCYPLPIIAYCLDPFKGSSWFAILDLRSSFYQVPFAEADRDKTVYITRRGKWRFGALPMGLSNSPATFQRLMHQVLRGLTWESVLVYIDDIVVYVHTFADLNMRLEEVFIRLRGANMKLKSTKGSNCSNETYSFSDTGYPEHIYGSREDSRYRSVAPTDFRARSAPIPPPVWLLSAIRVGLLKDCYVST